MKWISVTPLTGHWSPEDRRVAIFGALAFAITALVIGGSFA